MIALAADGGPTWIGLVGVLGLGAILSSLITAGSLIYQGRKNDERDNRRREADATERQRDREHQTSQLSAQFESTQRQEVSNYHRAQKYEAHAHAMNDLIRGLDEIRNGISAMEKHYFSNNSSEPLHGVSNETFESIRERLLVLQLLGSSDASAALSNAVNIVQVTERQLRQTSSDWDENSGDYLRQQSWQPARAAVEAYGDAARADLGIVD